MGRFLFVAIIILSTMAGLIVAGIYQEYGFFLIDPQTVIYDFKAQDLKHPETLRMFTPYFGAAVSIPMLLLAVAFRFRPKGEYGNSHWATDGEIKKMGLRDNSGVILGKKNGYLRYGEPLSTLVPAPPGTGKTSGLVIPNALFYPESLVCIDIKGEISDATAHVREKFSRVLILEPTGKSATKFNPFAKELLPKDETGLDEGGVISYVQKVSNLIYPQKKGDQGDSDIWQPNARNIFESLAVYLIYKNGETSLPEILSFADEKESIYEWMGQMTNPSNIDELDDLDDEEPEEEFEMEDPLDGIPPFVRQEFSSLGQTAYKTFDGYRNTFRTRLLVFKNPTIAENFSSNSFRFEDFRKGDKPLSLYIKVTEEDLERTATAIRILFDLLYKYLMSHTPSKDEYGVLGIFDEFPRMGYLPIVLKMPALGRGYLLPSIFCFQTESQVEEVYEKTGMRTLWGTTNYKVIFAQSDEGLAKRISDSIGNFTRIKKGDSESMRDGELKSQRSKSKNLEGVPLIRQDEILSLKKNEVIVMTLGNANTPIKAKAAAWHKDRKMKKLVRSKG